MSIYTGFIDGAVAYTDGTLKHLPFEDRIGTATLNYSGEIITSETFGSRGTKRVTQACPSSEQASIEFTTSNLSWSILQAAFNTQAETNTTVTPVVFSAIVPSNRVINLPTEAESTGISVADGLGEQYAFTYAEGASPTVDTVTLTDVGSVGKKVTVRYFRPANAERVINLGSGSVLPEVGLYGRFFGCPDTILLVAKRAIIVPNISATIGDGALEVSFTATLLADETETLAKLILLPSGTKY